MPYKTFPYLSFFLKSYEDLRADKRDSVYVSASNLKRVIRIRNINLHKKDLEKDHFGVEEIQTNNRAKSNLIEQIRDKMVNLGVKKKLKKNFRQKTITKFKNVNGTFFGEASRGLVG